MPDVFSQSGLTLPEVLNLVATAANARAQALVRAYEKAGKLLSEPLNRRLLGNAILFDAICVDPIIRLARERGALNIKPPAADRTPFAAVIRLSQLAEALIHGEIVVENYAQLSTLWAAGHLEPSPSKEVA